MLFRSKKKRVHSSIAVDSKRILSPESPFAITEAYRALYTNVLYLPIESKCKKLAVVSAVSGEGKTTVSLNLAYTIATNSSDSKVLIIDADMRKPRIARLLGYGAKKLSGLSEYLAGIDDTPALLETKFDNLFFLSSVAINGNSPALLSTSRMKSLMEYIEERFDYIIFDTPPVSVVSDALLLNDYVNGYIMVVKSEFSDFNTVSEAISRFEASEAKVLGMVMTAHNMKSVDGRSGTYSRYGKKYGYSYSYGYSTDVNNNDEESEA
jgi:capsular exopolysaccharide synthesis family protein